MTLDSISEASCAAAEGEAAAEVRRAEKADVKLADAISRLENHLDHSNSGIVLAEIHENDSLVTHVDDAQQTNLLQTERSRRALGR